MPVTISSFPNDAESGYVSLITSQGLPIVDADSAKGAVKRSYTVGHSERGSRNWILTSYCMEISDQHLRGRLLLGWAVHWPLQDPLLKLADAKADWFAFFGDLSALPAISVNLQRLPEDALGFAFESAPSGMTVLI